jgi:hypothetical protein
MSTWNVTAGRWKVNGPEGEREVDLERSASIPVDFAPGATTLEFTLVKPGQPTDQRADLGIGIDDVVVKGRTVTVTVHSLGAVDAPGGTVTLEDGAGKVLATAAVPPLTAPRELLPKTAQVRLTMPSGSGAGLRVRVALAGNAPETTMLNNVAPLAR